MRAARTSWGSGSPRRSRSTHHHEKQQGGGQQPPSPLLFLWHGKWFPKTFSQHASPSATQAPPQHLSPAAHSNFLPWSFLHCVDSERHGVSSLTGYHALLGPSGLQHLLPGAAHALPQHSPPPWHGKLSPFTFLQQRSPCAEQAPPQHLSPPAQLKFAPCRFLQCTGGKRRRVSEDKDNWSCKLTFWRNAKSVFSSLSHSHTEHSESPCATTRRASATIGANAILNAISTDTHTHTRIILREFKNGIRTDRCACSPR